MKLARLLVLLLIAFGSAAAFAQSPVIVAQVNLLNQSHPIPGTTIFTPTTAGIYRVSGYLAVASDQSSEWRVSLRWQDDLAERRVLTWLQVKQIMSLNQATQIVRLAAGEPLVYNVTLQEKPYHLPYNLFITVEQLESDQ